MLPENLGPAGSVYDAHSKYSKGRFGVMWVWHWVGLMSIGFELGGMGMIGGSGQMLIFMHKMVTYTHTHTLTVPLLV